MGGIKRILKMGRRTRKPGEFTLKVWRDNMGYSQRLACKELGCSRDAYRAWESGAHRTPRYIKLACHALALGIEPFDP